MPVEERLRAAFAEHAGEVRTDVEQRLAAVHRRRTRRRVALGTGLAAAVAAVALGVSVLVPGDAPEPSPATPPQQERVSDLGETVPLGTYVREVRRGEALAAGFPRGEVRWLFGDGDRARVEMRFREDPDGNGSANGWTVDFVDEAGERHGRDGGSFWYGNDGDLTILSLWQHCFGCTAHYAWHVAAGDRLQLDALSGTSTPMVRLLEGGVWRR